MPNIDLDIARAATPRPIGEIAAKLGISEDALARYGKYKAKIDTKPYRDTPRKAKLILTTAINPTPAGEGKTTISIGLTDALNRLGKNAVAVLREPSLGPVFGVKGGATGGGYAQVLPMEDINLHFTGDLHAITSANNLLAAMLDNSINSGNPLGIDPRQVSWRRCLDMNDRQLRSITSGLGGKASGTPREDGFDITAASEVMAVFCLARDLRDLQDRLGRIEVARTYDNKPVTASDLKANGAMCALLRDAFEPNIVQTLEGSPVLIHGGPFANIAHGCNSIVATELGMKLADYVVTEAGFGADLGCEKFIDIKCRNLEAAPSCVVIVATVRALKYHGGVAKDCLGSENVNALEAGMTNLLKHIRNVKDIWKLPAVVALNRFPTDTEAELSLVKSICESSGAMCSVAEVWAHGGKGGEELARCVLDSIVDTELTTTYPLELSLKEKIEAIAARVYGAAEVSFAPNTLTTLRRMQKEGAAKLPVCIAKTQYSFSDDASKLGEPKNFTLNIRGVRYSRGAGFVVAFAGDIIAMPGLPKIPAAEAISVDSNGDIVGLF